MSFFPLNFMPFLGMPVVSPLTIESLGSISLRNSGVSSFVYPAANRAIFIPFRLGMPMDVKRMFTRNGPAVAGNIDVGIYSLDGARLVSNGSVAQSGTSAVQNFDITDKYLSAGLYYMAVACSSASARLESIPMSAAINKILGLAQMDTAFPLPLSATFATMATADIPLIGLSGRSFI